MAAPSEKTLQDLSGKWLLNKELSDDFEPILQLQGFNWMLRQTVRLAPISLAVVQSVDDKGTTHLDVTQTVLGLISTQECRILDWTWRDHNDRLFGLCQHRAQWCKLADLPAEDKWLTEGWDNAQDNFIHSFVKNEANGWTAHLIWGFQTIDKGRFQMRRVLVRKGPEYRCARLVYNYDL